MPELYPEDQEKVDKFLREGVNNIERKPFKFWRLLAILLATLVLISIASYIVSSSYGFI